MLTKADVTRAASATGFQIEPTEKVMRLLGLLDGLKSHPFLKTRIALKGGTALNLFIADLPRLSVDIDLNYIGSGDRETMLEDRPKVEQAIEAVCGRLDIQVRRVPSDHAGGKWRLSYISALGRPGILELDINFMLRIPLWPPVISTSRSLGTILSKQVIVLDIHELAAGKIAALLARSAGRDLFDVRQILGRSDLNNSMIRLAFVVYGGCSRRDWREVTIEDIQADLDELSRQLLPLLRADLVPPKEKIAAWTQQLVEDCRRLLSTVLPLTPNERKFLKQLNDFGKIEPDLITNDSRLKDVIRMHPMLLWKARNVRKHKGGTL